MIEYLSFNNETLNYIDLDISFLAICFLFKNHFINIIKRMVKNQLFKNIPDLQIIQSILKCFGLDDIEDSRFFTKEHMIDVDTVQKITELSEELKEYYLPCKSKKYLGNLNEKKCITILRQFIKIHHYKCIGMEKSIKAKKTMTYRLFYSDEDYLKSPSAKQDSEYVLSFE